MAGLNGFETEAAIEIGDGGFRGGKGIALVVFLTGLGSGREGDRSKAGGLAGIGAENDP